jgi:hypothetical protein
MKQVAQEYGVEKVDALNCLDCLFGGKGRIDEVDPNHEFMFFYPGMIEFFSDAKEKMLKEGMDEQVLQSMFSGVKGIVLLDTLKEAEKSKKELEKLNTGLKILETKEIDLENLKTVIADAVKNCLCSIN